MKEENNNETIRPHEAFVVSIGSGLGTLAALRGRLQRGQIRQPIGNAHGTGRVRHHHPGQSHDYSHL